MYMDQMCKITEVFEPQHAYKVSGKCSITAKPVEVIVPDNEMFAIRQGRLNIQCAAPSLTSDEREFLMTGMSAEGWDKIFPPEEEEACNG